MKISISICPSDMTFANGDTYNGTRLCDAIYDFCKKRHPEAEVNVQIGHNRHNQGWRIRIYDGDDEFGTDLLTEFFEKHGTDDELFE